jgi:riboflavin kinase/FMN adenylyltransferase
MQVLSGEIDQLALPAKWRERSCSLTVGAFDGIHVGHQHLIRQLVRQAEHEDRLAGLVTFYPHPTSVLHPSRQTLYLTTPGEKTALLEPLGLDWLAFLPFSHDLAGTAPRVFVQQLYDRVHMRTLWVGPDFALGRNRKGDVGMLQHLGREVGFQVHEIPYVTKNGARVSSSQIRSLLRRGRVQEAGRLLGRHYSIGGEVVRGAQRGRCLGFPTANVLPPGDRIVPANGIYATYAYLGSERYASVTNVGVRPSFDNGERSVEAYLMDFDDDLYGCDLVIAFVARLRPERRYSDIQRLIAQIEQDVVQAREVLEATEP